MTFDNDSAIGKPAPSLESLEYVQGEPVAVGQGAPAVVAFWANFASGPSLVLLLVVVVVVLVVLVVVVVVVVGVFF